MSEKMILGRLFVLAFAGGYFLDRGGFFFTIMALIALFLSTFEAVAYAKEKEEHDPR